jgi:heme-degrading monooxygenase HmoA
MFARMTTGTVAPDRLDAMARLYREELGVTMRQLAGFRRGLLLADRASGAIVSTTLWDTEAAARAQEKLAGRMRAQATLTLDIRRALAAEVFEVALAAGDGRGSVACLVRATGRTDGLADGIRRYGEEVLPLLCAQAGFAGGYLYVARWEGTVLALSLWESAAAMRQSEPGVAVQQVRIAGLVGAATATVADYEVLVEV